MRLDRLELTRYGKFTDRSLAFGEAGALDLHIVYGPNEAGKSTAVSAFLDLLFGIGHKSTYAFLHSYDAMEIGARLELEGKALDLIRRKGRKSLFDGQYRPIDEHVLEAALAGIDRDGYKTAFSLDDATLEKGGESILNSKGELGYLLFQASAGLASLSAQLETIRADADGFFRPQGRQFELNRLKRELDELKRQRDELDTLAHAYAQLVRTRDEAAAAYDAAMAERSAVQARRTAVQRRLDALPKLAQWRALRDRLAPLCDLPPPPLGATEELPALRREATELATARETAHGNIRRLEAERDTLVLDEPALAIAARLDALKLPIARYTTAVEDLPKRRLRLREHDTTIKGHLRDLDRADEPQPRRLLLGAAVTAELRELGERRSGIDAALANAEKELARARDLEAEAREQRDRVGGVAVEEAVVDDVRTALKALEAGEHLADRRAAETELRNAEERLARRLERLAPWRGDADRLAALTPATAEELARLRADVTRATQERDTAASALAETDTEIARLDAEIASLRRSPGAVTAEEVEERREAREVAWARHRAALDPQTADAFEAAMRADDLAQDARLTQSQLLAAQHEAQKRRARLEVDRDATKKRLEVAEETCARLEAQRRRAVAVIDPPVPDDVTLEWLQAWIDRREQALACRDEVATARVKRRGAQEAHAEARAALARALSRAGAKSESDTPETTLVETARELVSRAGDQARLEEAIRERRRARQERERDLDAARRSAEHWDARWRELLDGSWLGERTPLPGVAVVNEILDVLARLEAELTAREGVAARIESLEKDEAALLRELDDLTSALALDAGGVDPLVLIDRIEGRVDEATRVHDRRRTVETELADANTHRRELEQRAETHDRRVNELAAWFKVTSLDELDQALQRAVQKADLAERASALEAEIVEALELADIATCQAELDATTRDDLEAARDELTTRYDDEDARIRELHTAKSRAQDAIDAVGGDDAVARLEEQRRTRLVQIEEAARRHLRLRAGILACDLGLEAYRERHQSSMMARASDAFVTISGGEYARLTSRPAQGSEQLIAVSGDGQSKTADQLSKGTCFQLYLALRIAGYHEFLKSRPPLPFVADDILETFDDDRARRSFELLADMARHGQVIYLTHHNHLCRIAEEAVPDVRIHQIE